MTGAKNEHGRLLFGFALQPRLKPGARVGRKVLIRPTATVTYPWKVEIGDYAWIGDDAVIYSLGPIQIGAHAVVSQRSYLCAADHDAAQPEFPLRERAVRIEDGAWVATDVFVGPGVTIGENTVVGAGAVEGVCPTRRRFSESLGLLEGVDLGLLGGFWESVEVRGWPRPCRMVLNFLFVAFIVAGRLRDVADEKKYQSITRHEQQGLLGRKSAKQKVVRFN